MCFFTFCCGTFVLRVESKKEHLVSMKTYGNNFSPAFCSEGDFARGSLVHSFMYQPGWSHKTKGKAQRRQVVPFLGEPAFLPTCPKTIHRMACAGRTQSTSRYYMWVVSFWGFRCISIFRSFVAVTAAAAARSFTGLWLPTLQSWGDESVA